MNNIRLTKEFKFEMAHALHGYDGPCRNIHGHSYDLTVTVLGKPNNVASSPKKGMVMDFGELKAIVTEEIINVFDHALMLNSDIHKDLINERSEMFGKVVYVDYQPTSENMLIDFVARVKKRMPHLVSLHSMKLSETATSYAEWFASDNI